MDVNLSRVEKRNRPPLSCEPCRSRKLKCNRELPCDTCARRNKISICNYATNASRVKSGTPKVRNLKDRLDSVEQLVLSFLASDEVVQHASQAGFELSTDDNKSTPSSRDGQNSLLQHTPASSNSVGTRATQIPHLHETSDGQVNYIDSSHWLSVLDDIREVREHFAVSHQTMPRQDLTIERDYRVPDAMFPYPTTSTPDITEILGTLPSRPICDMLLSWYFNSRFMVLGIVHPSKFQDEYTLFWESPSTSSPLWLALLFSILSVTLTLRRASNLQPDPSISTVQQLQHSTIQCLVLGRYANANEHALEAFVLHIQSSFFSGSAPTDLWFEMGTIIRLAFRMGYHRDPNILAGISPFDGEMRRRVWMNIFQIDALMSFQLGFPSMIPTDFCDTEVPKNLEYTDLQVGMATLPPSRSLSEHTHILYGIVKANVMGVFKKIVTHTQSLTAISYDRTIALDAEMKRVYAAVPESYKPRDVGSSFLDHSSLVWQRCTIEVLYLKGLIVLHRPYINDLHSQEFPFSQRACVDAALAILSRQLDLHQACEPGGRLYEDRWMMASIPAHDFLLAAMVVCLDCSFCIRTQNDGWIEKKESQQTASREVDALQASRQIWAAKGVAVPEARMATRALDLMIEKMAKSDVGFVPVHDDSPGLPNVSHDGLPYAATMSDVIDGSEAVDWSLWDHYLQGLDPSIFNTVG